MSVDSSPAGPTSTFASVLTRVPLPVFALLSNALPLATALPLANALLLATALMLRPDVAAAQEISGRIVDSANGAPVGLAIVFVLDAGRDVVEIGSANAQGFYTVEIPGSGEFYLAVERLGYFENETPLLAVEEGGSYGVDIEMRPEPFRLDPLDITVENEALEDFLKLSFGVHPATLPGYRSIQGIRLEEAKLKADDNTDLLRWLYIPVTHGARVCVGTFGAPQLPARSGWERQNASGAAADAQSQCGALYVDDRRCRNELIDTIDMDRIGVVVTFRGAVHMYTRDFDWTFRPGGGVAEC